MFGLSFSELVVIGVVALIVVGPQKLPGMLHQLGQWARKLRQMTTEVRAQSGIDQILKAEGLHGGLTELRGLMRGGHQATQPEARRPRDDPYANLEVDLSREYPPEGPDSYGALPEDLLDEASSPAAMLEPAELKPSEVEASELKPSEVKASEPKSPEPVAVEREVTRNAS